MDTGVGVFKIEGVRVSGSQFEIVDCIDMVFEVEGKVAGFL
jgi:hypothetical protein